MRLKAYRRLGETPIIADVSVVVVEDENGTPVAVSQEFSAGGRTGICTVHAGEPEFNRVLQQLGIRQLVVVDRLSDQLARRPVDMPLLSQP